jgi:hypothetical protein
MAHPLLVEFCPTSWQTSSVCALCSTTLSSRLLTVALAGVYNVVIAITFACGVITLATLAVDNNTGIICLAALYGFPGGAYISLLGPLFASLSQSVNEVGRVSSIPKD